MGFPLGELLDALGEESIVSSSVRREAELERVEWLVSFAEENGDELEKDVLCLVPLENLAEQSPREMPEDKTFLTVAPSRERAEQLCKDAGFGLCCIVTETPYPKVFNRIINLVPGLLQPVSIGRFTEIMRCTSLQSIANIGSGLLGSPVAILDRIYNVVAVTADAKQPPFWDTIHLGKYLPLGDRALYPLQKAFEKSSGQNGTVAASFPDGTQCVVKTVKLDNVILGYIFSMKTSDTPFGEEATEVLELMGLAATKLMLGSTGSLEKGQKTLTVFLSELLMGKEAEPEAVKHWLKESNWRVEEYAYLLVLRDRSGEPLGEEEIKLLDVWESDRAFPFKGDVIWIMSQNRPLQGVDEERIRPLQDLLTEKGWIGGISRRMSTIGQAAKYYRQARYSMELCLKVKPPKCMLPYSQAWIDDFLDAVRDKVSLEEYCVPQLLALEKYDRDTQKQLMDTLACYFENNQSVQKTAESLYLHRNTVNYRLSKCAEILETDLSDRGRSARIFLAMKILSCLRETEEYTRE